MQAAIAAEPWGLIAIRRPKVAGPVVALAMFSLAFANLAPTVLALRMPSLAATDLAVVRVPVFDFPAVPIPKLHAVPPLRHSARSITRPARSVATAMPAPAHRSRAVTRVRVFTNKFEYAPAAKHAAAKPAKDPFAHVPVVENAIGSQPPDMVATDSPVDTATAATTPPDVPVGDASTGRLLHAEASSPLGQAEALGRQVAEALLAQGARELLG